MVSRGSPAPYFICWELGRFCRLVLPAQLPTQRLLQPAEGMAQVGWGRDKAGFSFTFGEKWFPQSLLLPGVQGLHAPLNGQLVVSSWVCERAPYATPGGRKREFPRRESSDKERRGPRTSEHPRSLFLELPSLLRTASLQASLVACSCTVPGNKVSTLSPCGLSQ